MTTIFNLLKSWTFRLLLLFAVLFAGAAVLAISYVGWKSDKLLEESLKQALSAEIRGLLEQYRTGGSLGVIRLAKAIDRRIRRPSNTLYHLTDKNGLRIAGNVKALTHHLWNAEGRVEFAYRRKTARGVETRHAVAYIYRLARGYRLMVGKNIEDQRQFARITRTTVLTGLGFMVFIGLTGAWLVSRHLLKRIDNITSTTRIIMAGDMGKRVPIDGSGDEFDRLASSLNAMLERIEQLMNDLRDVTDNIAHDLKTPLNRMRNRVETALRDGGQGSCREVLEKTIEESDELIRTFNALLSIARLEAGTGGANVGTHDLQDIIRDVAELYEPLAEEQKIQLMIRQGASINVVVDRQLLGQAIANLIENAIKYGKSEEKEEGAGQIMVEAAHCPAYDHEYHTKTCCICVSDRGRGIAAEETELAMRRFGRLEKSRTQPGTGLGLSLVAAVAKLHGGELRLENNQPGLICKIIIPCDEPSNPRSGSRQS